LRSATSPPRPRRRGTGTTASGSCRATTARRSPTASCSRPASRS
jgi:hypothetical protein